MPYVPPPSDSSVETDSSTDVSAPLDGGGTRDASAPLDGSAVVDAHVPPTSLYVFIIGGSFDGAFAGNFNPKTDAERGDYMCTRAAQASTIPAIQSVTKWMAWLSDSNEDSAPARRFTSRAGTAYESLPYVMLRNNVSDAGFTVIVANNWAELTSGTIQHVIDINQNGNQMTTAPLYVWTNTKPDGTISP